MASSATSSPEPPCDALMDEESIDDFFSGPSATSFPKPPCGAPMEEQSIDKFFSSHPFNELFFKIKTAEFLKKGGGPVHDKNFTMLNMGVSTQPKKQLKIPPDANGKQDKKHDKIEHIQIYLTRRVTWSPTSPGSKLVPVNPVTEYVGIVWVQHKYQPTVAQLHDAFPRSYQSKPSKSEAPLREILAHPKDYDETNVSSTPDFRD